MSKIKLILLTLGIAFVVLLLLTSFYNAGRNYQELKDLECSIGCDTVETSNHSVFDIETEVCSCYNKNNELVYSGRLE